MNDYFDYDSYMYMSPGNANAFFISFEILFSLFMKNMFIAIIVAHYNEFHLYDSMNASIDEDKTKNSFIQLLF